MPGRQAIDKIIDTGVPDANGKSIAIRGSEIRDYLNQEFIVAWTFYCDSCRMKDWAPPYGGPWTTWPEEAVTAIKVFSEEETRWRREQEDGE